MEHLYSAAMYVFLIVGFIALWIWAWSSKRKSTFDEMSRLPLEDDDIDVKEQKRDKS